MSIDLLTAAANLISEDNPPYTAEDFVTDFPEMTAAATLPLFPTLLAMAHGSVNVGRWGDAWRLGMGLFLAHHCTLLLRGFTPSASTAAEAVDAGAVEGLLTEQRTGGGESTVQLKFEHGSLQQADWGMWNATQYGLQFATYAKLTGMAGAVVI